MKLKIGIPHPEIICQKNKAHFTIANNWVEPKIFKETLHKNEEKQKQYFDNHTKELSVLHLINNARYMGITHGD